jgi:multidrug efflux pump
MFANFFIERPIFAAVLSIVITLVGAIALIGLPIAQYPRIAPPTVQVQSTYLGANAEVVEQSVATPIEQQVNGVEGMLYMSSLSSNDGQMSLTVTSKSSAIRIWPRWMCRTACRWLRRGFRKKWSGKVSRCASNRPIS